MALHDFRCPQDGLVAVDQYVPIAIRASQLRPICRCGCLMEWIPAVGRMDLMPFGQVFSTQIRQPDGSVKTVQIDSLATIRRLERESEIRYANGEGAPLRWRDYSNDRNRQYENSFGPSPADVAHEEAKGSRARLSVHRYGGTAPDVALGPAVTESTMSPLALDPV